MGRAWLVLPTQTSPPTLFVGPTYGFKFQFPELFFKCLIRLFLYNIKFFLKVWIINISPPSHHSMSDSKHVSKNEVFSRKRKARFQLHGRPSIMVRNRFRASPTAKKALSLVRRLNKAQEVKMFDHTVGVNTIGVNGVMFNLSDVLEGGGFFQREGKAIFIFKLDVRWVISTDPSDIVTLCRIIIFQDRRQVSGVQPLPATILAELHPLAQLNTVHRTRFKIFQDTTFNVDDNATKAFHGHLVAKMQVKAEFSGASATSWTTNGMYMLAISNESTNLPSLSFTSRILYNDN